MPTRNETLDYIGQITMCLADMARADGYGTIAMMLDMVALEVVNQNPSLRAVIRPSNGALTKVG
jgi:hypothetical protein